MPGMYIGIVVSIGGIGQPRMSPIDPDPPGSISTSWRCIRVLGEFPRRTRRPVRSATVAEDSAEIMMMNFSRSTRPKETRPLCAAPRFFMGLRLGGPIQAT
jgi:hypothetical protein